MSSFASKINDIKKLRFEPIPTSPIDVVQAVRCDQTSALLGADGLVYTDAVRKRVCYSGVGHRHEDLFRCCVKLKVVTASCVREHIATQKRISLVCSRKWAAENALSSLKVLGIEPSPTQFNIIEKALNPGVVKGDG